MKMTRYKTTTTKTPTKNYKCEKQQSKEQSKPTNQPTLITKDIKNFLDELDFVFGFRSRKDTISFFLYVFSGDSGGGDGMATVVVKWVTMVVKLY